MLLANLASRAPVVLVLDDVHLADASSWEALSYVARRAAESPMFVLATARPELSEQPAAAQVIAALEQEGRLDVIRLEPLGRDAVRELAEAVLTEGVSSPTRSSIGLRSTPGNPLFAIDLLGALVEEGADLSSPRLERLPERLRDRVGVRLQPLDEPQRATLDVVAILGQRVRLGDLVDHTRLPLEQLAPILEELVRMRLLAEEERGRELTYEISHPLVQEAIYERIGGARRRVLHRAVARTLAAQGRPGAAAPHFARSAEVGDDEAIDCAADGDAPGRGSGVLPGVVRDPARPPRGDTRLATGVGSASSTRWRSGPEWVADHRADVDAFTGIKALREIDRLLESSPDLARRGMVLFRLATFLGWDAGEVEEAQRLQRQAIQLLEQGGDPGDGAPRCDRARLPLECRWRLRSGRGQARAVVQAAEVAGDGFAAMHALGLLGWAYAYLGNLPAAEEAFRQTIGLAREEGKLYRLTYGLVGLAATHLRAGRADEARAALAEGRRVNPTGYWDTILVETEVL